MTNNGRGEIEVKLSGKTRLLRFNTNTLAVICHELGGKISAYKALKEAVESPIDGSLHLVVRACLYAGLREGGASPASVDAVGRAMKPAEMTGYVDACLHGILLAYGVDPSDQEKPQEADEVDPLGVVTTREANSNTSGSSVPEPSL